MKEYATDRLRNVALVGHGGSGKTSLVEAMLHTSGAVQRLGKVDQGTSVSDYDSEEIRRGISLSTSLAPCEWNNAKINLFDTPGYFDFVGEVYGSLRVVDGVVCVVCASSGVEVGTEKAWAYAEEYQVPKIVFVNKMDRENARFENVMEQLTSNFGSHVIPIQLPIGAAETFEGFVDLISQKAYRSGDGKMVEGPIPDDMADAVEAARDALIEAVAATDDELTMKYLEDEAIKDDEIRNALAIGTKGGDIVPVLCGSATGEVGVGGLLDYAIACLPSPAEAGEVEGTNPDSGESVTRKPGADEPLSALVFKTVVDPYVGKLNLFRVYSGTLHSDSTIHNASKERDERLGQVFVLRGKEQIPVDQVTAGDIAAVAKLQETTTGDTLCDASAKIVLQPVLFPQPTLSMAILPKAKGDEEKIGTGLSRLLDEDPTFTAEKDPETGEQVISGMGEMHLEVITSRLKDKFGVEVELTPPKVPYRETIRSKTNSEYKHKKQSGGRGQYGHVVIELEPNETGAGFEFVDKVFGGSVPRQYIPAVEKGVRETLEEGVLAGYPVVDVRVTLLDGSAHSVDSSEMAFKLAASMAFKQGFMNAKPVLLEPIMDVEVVVPERYMGDVIGDLNKKRGRIMGMDPDGDTQVIRATAPMSEMFRYGIDLRSMTQGRGSFSMKFDHYDDVPGPIAEKVIENANEKVS